MKENAKKCRWLLVVLSVICIIINIALLVGSGYMLDEHPGTPVRITKFNLYCNWIALLLGLVMLIFSLILLRKRRHKITMIIFSVFFACGLIFNAIALIDHVVLYYKLETTTIASAEVKYTSAITLQEMQSAIRSDDTAIIYIGRPSCPDCMKNQKALEKLFKQSKENILYYNTTKDRYDNNEQMNEVLGSVGVTEIPTIIQVRQGVVQTLISGDNFLKDAAHLFQEIDR